jgi:hypothetical protein
MTLNPQDYNRMEYLLGKQSVEGLLPNEEYELRNIITHENPAAKDKALGDLVALGMIIVGFYLLAKAFEKK